MPQTSHNRAVYAPPHCRGKSWATWEQSPASLSGIASPLCMYGTIPIAASFSAKGMEYDWLAAFMMSSILLNPQLLFYSAALGPAALVIRFASCFLCGIAAGLCIRMFFKNGKFFNFSGFSVPENRDADPNPFLRFLKNLGRNVKATGIYFLIGLILSALFQRYVPDQAGEAGSPIINQSPLVLERSYGRFSFVPE